MHAAVCPGSHAAKCIQCVSTAANVRDGVSVPKVHFELCYEAGRRNIDSGCHDDSHMIVAYRATAAEAPHSAPSREALELT